MGMLMLRTGGMMKPNLVAKVACKLQNNMRFLLYYSSCSKWLWKYHHDPVPFGRILVDSSAQWKSVLGCEWS